MTEEITQADRLRSLRRELHANNRLADEAAARCGVSVDPRIATAIRNLKTTATQPEPRQALPEESHEALRQWAFNTALECSRDGDLTMALGGAVVDFRDLNRILDWAVNVALSTPEPTKGE